MNIKWKKTMTSIVFSTTLITSAYPVLAADLPEPEPTAQGQQNAIVKYQLTDNIEVDIKSILNEHTADGTRLGAVVRMRNTSTQLTRMPDFELRLKTSDGVEYTLQASAKNAKSIQPKSQQELSYFSVIDRSDEIQVSEVNWVDVDVYVYPKKETFVLSVPMTSQSWKGNDAKFIDPSAIKKWGESFTIPALQSPLVYTPVSINKDFLGQNPVTVFQVLVSNPTDKSEYLPDFVMDGKTSKQIYSGKRSEGALALEPGEKQYIHFVIPTELDTELVSLNVLTPEKFTGTTGDVSYKVGRLNILLPAESTGNHAASFEHYKLGTKMKLDSINKSVHPDMDVSIVELHMQENEGDGFKTAVAKFKLLNKSDHPLPVPSLQTELVSSDGYSYPGSRQNVTTQRILPNGATVVNYSFTLPASEKGTDLVLRLLENQATAASALVGVPTGTASALAPAPNAYTSIIASYAVDVQTNTDNKKLSLYPLEVNVNDWTIAAISTPQQTYNYKVKLFLDIVQQKDVVLDPNFSKLQFDLVDLNDRLIATSTAGFFGMDRLISGTNKISLTANSEQLDYPVTLKVYEFFTNANGELVKRLLTTYKQ